jgi:hypothetical protein
MNKSNTEEASRSHAAERMRLYRQRRRQGLRYVRIPLRYSASGGFDFLSKEINIETGLTQGRESAQNTHILEDALAAGSFERPVELAGCSARRALNATSSIANFCQPFGRARNSDFLLKLAEFASTGLAWMLCNVQ